ncbi:BON domain-containing protein [Legionella sp. CNM-4043-24]|uniref:BON domain-containing protein n=1 Tax=Legionella sp. CNM-4043-24 TaxID=3421646 RepID=UPI00403B19FE
MSRKQGLFLSIIVAGTSLLTSCFSGIWTGATLVYDRHNVYKKIDDYSLSMTAHHVLFDDKLFRQEGACLDLAVFNGDVLLAGHLPNARLRRIARQRINSLSGYRKLFFQVAVEDQSGQNLNDSWITTKIRSRIITDSAIDPNQFKIITVDGIVYIMGDVRPHQALRVIEIARSTRGVLRVVKLMRYFNLSEKPAGGG